MSIHGRYDHLYKPSPQFIRYHEEDKNLKLNIIDVQLPEQPAYSKMINYGMHPKDQKFSRPIIPKKLKELDRKRHKDIEQYWKELTTHRDYYKEEFEFIRQDWERRENGIWILINGQATYLNGLNYFFLSSYTIGPTKGVYFDYRDRDRRWFIFAKFCDLDPSCWGFNYPKHRREGATSKVASIILNYATYPSVSQLLNNALKHGIQSKDGDSAEMVFLSHIVPQYKNLRFWQIPRNSNPSNPKAELNFGPLSTKKSKDDAEATEGDYFNTRVDFRASGELLYDGDKLRVYMGDEAGKLKEANVEKRTSTVRLCCSLGNRVIGLIINPSTVGEMDREGGTNFQSLCNDSMYGKKDNNGQTTSGLYNLFMPAYDGLEGMVGPFGESIIDDPTEDQSKWLWEASEESKEVCEMQKTLWKRKHGNLTGFKLMGAKQYLLNRRADLIKNRKTAQLSKEKRQHPMEWAECWTIEVDDSCPFDLNIIETRLEKFAVGSNPFVMHGSFVWENWDNTKWMPQDLPTLDDFISGKTRVVWKGTTDKENAEWEISYLFPDDKDSNKKIFNPIYQSWEPGNKTRFCAGADTAKLKPKPGELKKKKGSFYAGSIFHKFDSSIDDLNEINPNEENARTGDTKWITNRFCGLYLQKPQLKAMYGEALLKACIYYGCTMYPEHNFTTVADYFDETRGFGEWLQFKVNKKTKRIDPGVFQATSERAIIEIYAEWKEYIANSGLREVHPLYLLQCRNVVADGMTFCDAFASGGYALLNLKQSSLYKLDEEKKSQSVDWGDIIDFHSAMS